MNQISHHDDTDQRHGYPMARAALATAQSVGVLRAGAFVDFSVHCMARAL